MNSPKNRIHYARIETSARLRRVYQLLTDGEWHGTWDIMTRAEVCAASTAIAELRANGFDIETRCVGRGLYEYRILAVPLKLVHPGARQ
jgi:hypothetical protein